ncbi:MAG: hypothetical protein ACLR4Z_05220 [Butyricicoccaceae bacterium]
MGIEVTLLTGDNQTTARTIAGLSLALARSSQRSCRRTRSASCVRSRPQAARSQ